MVRLKKKSENETHIKIINVQEIDNKVKGDKS